MISPIAYPAALVAGALIGWSFGVLQLLAARHNERLQQEGRLRSAWSVMPGSAGRVAILLVGLAMIQITCPLFFDGGVEWFVSAGVLAGYGTQLFLRLRRRMREIGT